MLLPTGKRSSCFNRSNTIAMLPLQHLTLNEMHTPSPGPISEQLMVNQVTNVHTHPVLQAGEGTVPPCRWGPFSLYSGFLLSLPFAPSCFSELVFQVTDTVSVNSSSPVFCILLKNTLCSAYSLQSKTFCNIKLTPCPQVQPGCDQGEIFP